MTGSNEGNQSTNCLHRWETVMVTDEVALFSCRKCHTDRIVRARYIDNLFDYDGMSLDELESYEDKDVEPCSILEAMPWLKEDDNE